uniref:Uncharacterized protein n=1 Tax=Lactuca sativa TaxID=4236 RepID=A0A9R1WM16_LACSA|nr:hypothetical protein LSAT_V11C100025980 [Lactuca sativa]
MENNLYCCTWFLMRLQEALSSCIEHVFPDSFHGYISKSVWKYMCKRENFCRLTLDAREVLANIGHFNGRRLTNVLTPYTEIVFHKRMQKSIRWQATKILPEIPSPLPPNIYQVFDFKKTCVVNSLNYVLSSGTIIIIYS